MRLISQNEKSTVQKQQIEERAKVNIEGRHSNTMRKMSCNGPNLHQIGPQIHATSLEMNKVQPEEGYDEENAEK